MFRNILVPLDGSELAEQVLPTVARLVEGSDAEVTLFRVEHAPAATPRRRRGPRKEIILGASLPGAAPSGFVPAMNATYAETRDQAVERLEHELLEYLEVTSRALADSGRPLHVAVRFGDPAEEIPRFVRRGSFDLVVMATHGRSGLRARVQGSVATAVVRSGAAPVLVVRPKKARPGKGEAQ